MQHVTFQAPAEVAVDGDDLRGESSANSTPNMSPRASNHSLHSNLSTSEVGSVVSMEQEDAGNDLEYSTALLVVIHYCY